jgi:hypothetical protein
MEKGTGGRGIFPCTPEPMKTETRGEWVSFPECENHGWIPSATDGVHLLGSGIDPLRTAS